MMIKHKPHIVPKYVLYGFFFLGLLSAIAFRSIVFFQRFNPSWVRPVWYIGISGYVLFFLYRYHITVKRKKAISDYQLLEKVKTKTDLSDEERDVLTYLLSSIKVSHEDWNYALIFMLSILAIASDIALTFMWK